MTTSFVGLSHLGLVSSICWASLGQSVYAIDPDKKLIKQLSENILTLKEPQLKEVFKKAKKYYKPTTDFSIIKNADLIFLSQDTPLDKPESLTEINELIGKIIPHLTENSSLIILSQVTVGFTRNLYKKIKTKHPNLNFNLYYFLNTLIIGDSVNRFLKPERIVIGSNNPNQPLSINLSNTLSKFNAPIITMKYESAEMTKTAINLFLASSITTANTLSDYCEAVGADYNEIIPALKTDKRIGPNAYLKPTLRISGGHLERELFKLNKLSKKHKIKPGIEKSIQQLNTQRLNWLYKKIAKLKPKSICLWGLSYKKDTSSTDNAPSVEIIKKFGKTLQINAYDPSAILPKDLKNYQRFSDKYKALNKTDLLIVLTNWDEFKNPETKKFNGLTIIDCVDILYPLKGNFTDSKYISMGANPS